MSEKKKLQNKQIEKRVQENKATWSRGNSEKSAKDWHVRLPYLNITKLVCRRAVWIDVTAKFAM